MLYLFLFIFELVILFATSRFVFKSLFLLFHTIFKSKKISISVLSLLFFPGVVVHEFSHFIIAEVLQVRSYGMEFSPEVVDGEVKMGSIQVAQTDFIRRFLIGVAPVIVGSIFIVALLFFYFSFFDLNNLFSSISSSLYFILIIFAVFVTSNTMFSSNKDMEGVFGFLLFVIFITFVIVIFMFLMEQNPFQFMSGFLNSSQVIRLLSQIVFIFTLPVGINLFFSVFAILLRKR